MLAGSVLTNHRTAGSDLDIVVLLDGGLTDLLDDLASGVDEAERVVVTAATWTATAELALHNARHWIGRGKWLLRELRDLDPALAGRWLSASGDPAAVTALATEVLDAAGGPLFDGYRAAG